MISSAPSATSAVTPSGPPAAAVIREWTWKTPAMRDMTLAVCRLALARGTGGEFSALDLPTHGEAAHGGSGIAGTVFGQLAKAGILAPVGVWIEGEFVQRIKKNAHGNRIGVWRLAHPGLCRALLRVHAPADVTAATQEILNLES